MQSKVLTLEELTRRRERARAEGRRVVQCHGCFDIVHPGHIRHLRQARSHGDILLVSITGDRSWTKRQNAPLIPGDLRADNLAELDCVDWVYIEDRPTAVELLSVVKPDVYVKGREYEHNHDPRFAAERSAVEQAGGRVVFSSGDVVFSSTALISAMERSIDPYHARLVQLLAKPELDGLVLDNLVSRFRGKRVLVVGETILDRYLLCDQPEVAAESPVLTLRPLERRCYDGGAAVIARHLAAMGASPVLLTGLPTSSDEGLTARLAAEGIGLMSVPIAQPLARKDRYLVGTQKVMKINDLLPIVLDAKTQDTLVAIATHAADGFDAAVIADYGNGFLTPSVIERLSASLRPRVPIMSGDVSGSKAPLASFRSFDLLSPSESELRSSLRCFDDSLPAAAWKLLSVTGTRRMFLTLGGEGLIAFEPLQNADDTSDPDPNRSRVRGEHIPALSHYPVDPLGCGDALLSAGTLCLAAGGDLVQAGLLGSIAAACEAQRLGNNPVSAGDLRRGLARLLSASLAYAPDLAAARPADRVGLLAS